MIVTKFYFTNGASFKVPCIKYMPATYRSGLIPVVVALHGVGENGDGSDSGFARLANSNNFANLLTACESHGVAVVTPQFVQAFNYSVDIAGKLRQSWVPDWAGGVYVNDTIEWVKANMPVDLTKLYLTGLSAGGGGCWDYISLKQEYSDKIAATLILCGTEQSGIRNWNVAKTVPVWAFHGDADPVINVGASERQVQLCGGILTKLPGAGHSIWTEVYGRKDVYDWLFSFIKGKPQQGFQPTHKLIFPDGTIQQVRIEPV